MQADIFTRQILSRLIKISACISKEGIIKYREFKSAEMDVDLLKLFFL